MLSSFPPARTHLPIVFVHGDSDSAGHWMVQIWRFESNGYLRERLFAVDIPHPSARADIDVAEVNRSSPSDAAEALSKVVDRALAETGERQLVLVGNSRGCQTARNYLKNHGGAGKVAGMVLTGCVHNGVFVRTDSALGSEYNGAGRFLTALNAAPLIPDGVFVTVIRSDRFDLYSQPDGKFIGDQGVPTGADHHFPDLDGADNRILEGADHRETGYSPEAFALMHAAITGAPPATMDIMPEAAPILSGRVTGHDNEAPSNRPIAGSTLAVFRTDPQTGARLGDAVLRQSLDNDGRWGPLTADPAQTYEFEITAPGLPVHHIFRSPFPRSTEFANLRLYPAVAGEGHAVGVMRPRGYFGPAHRTDVNGQSFPGIDMDEPVPHVWQVRVPAEAGESVVATFEGERIAAAAPPAGHVAWIELSY